MELSVMERYVAFICGELPKTRGVLLTPPTPMENGEYGYKRINKIGPHVYMMVDIVIVEKYTRSAKLCVKFEDYQMNDIFYMSRHKGPDKLLEEIDKKIDKIVNRTLIDDGRQEWVREQYKIKSDDFYSKFKILLPEIDLFSNLYERYLAHTIEGVKNGFDRIKGYLDNCLVEFDGSYEHFSNPSFQYGYRPHTQEEFIEKLKTDEEFYEKWGGMRKNILE